MILKSLSGRLLTLWLLLLVSAVTTGVLMTAFFRQSASAQVDRADDSARRACSDIVDRYAFFSAGSRGADQDLTAATRRDELTAVVDRALIRARGVEGGIWSRTQGPLAYAFPTYEGTGPKKDLPAAELPSISEINARSDRTGRPEGLRLQNASQVLVLQACPLAALSQGSTAWTMTRVFVGSGEAYRRLLIGLAVLAATVFGSALWLASIMLNWSRRVRGIEHELSHSQGERPRSLSLTGERELDRLIEAVNNANLRSTEALRTAATDQRLAAVGLLAAGVAHEIRNPIAAMRLKAENALASRDIDRTVAALESNLRQIGRVDRILRDLLTMTEAPKLKMSQVDLSAFFKGISGDLQESAQLKGVTLKFVVEPDVDGRERARFDEGRIGRAVCNLIDNAIQHTPQGGDVVCRARRVGDRLHVLVEDTGAGVLEPLAERIFEPFVTGRADGTGLGLTIVRETARAHHGDARLLPGQIGACFEIEIPWNNPQS